MKTLALALATTVAALASSVLAADYVIAVERDTFADSAWREVVQTLQKRHSAKVIRYDGNAALEKMLPELRRLAPRYVAFVSRPETAGRDLVIGASQLLRRLDDDPFGDALWGIVTGFDAADALRIARAPAAREIRRPATSMGNAGALNGWEAGFASNEGNRNELWRKFPGGKTEKIDTRGNVAKSLAAAFNAIDVDYFVTSGHATQHDWQIIYNQNAGSLRHDENANLVFRNPQGESFPLNRASPKIYLAAGNCLIGNIDRRACMATAWLHDGGADQMCGYTVVTFFGFMGWGVKSILEEGRASFAEAYYLQNQILLWALAQRKPGTERLALTEPEFGGGHNAQHFLNTHVRDLVTAPDKNGKVRLDGDLFGMLWDRDIVAFYGDPAMRVTFPERCRTVKIEVNERNVTVRFLREVNFGALSDVKSARPLITLLDRPAAGKRLLDAAGKPVEKAVVNDRFLLIPLQGKHAAGTTLSFKLAD